MKLDVVETPIFKYRWSNYLLTMLTINRKSLQIYKIIEYIAFICLFVLSTCLMKNVFEKYIKRETSLLISEQPLPELPTLTLCFSFIGKFETDLYIFIIHGPQRQNVMFKKYSIKWHSRTTQFWERCSKCGNAPKMRPDTFYKKGVCLNFEKRPKPLPKVHWIRFTLHNWVLW